VSSLPDAPGRTLVQSAAYTKAFDSLGDARRIDEALTGALWALSTRPEVYDIVKGYADIRLLKTKPAGDVPALWIWFRIDADGKNVHLEFIEKNGGEE